MWKLYVVGVRSGNYEDLAIKADRILKCSDLIYCDENLYKMLKNHFDIVHLDQIVLLFLLFYLHDLFLICLTF